MKICVATARFAFSGVGLAQIRFAKAWAAAGHEVDFLIGYVGADVTLPDLTGLNLIVLDRTSVRQLIAPVAGYLRRARPEIVFCAEDHFNGAVLIAAILAGSRAKISGSSRVPPSDSYSNRPFTKGWFRKMLLKAVMWRADALTCVSKDMVNSYRVYFPDGPHVAVYNIINDTTSLARAAMSVDHPWFTQRDLPIVVSAGTLTGRKNFKLMVAAIGELHRRGRAVRLAIFGEGYRRPELEAQIAELGIADQCWLPGRDDNPLRYFSHADVIALSSYAEGLPNVLIEGMICGCTPVATNCPTGPREVIEGAGVGHLVAMDDVTGMADAIEQAIDRPADQAALRKAVEPFSEATVMHQHLELLGLAAPRVLLSPDA